MLGGKIILNVFADAFLGDYNFNYNPWFMAFYKYLFKVLRYSKNANREKMRTPKKFREKGISSTVLEIID